MSKLKLNRLFRMQWEEAQQCHVLLYPEGMVQLNQPASEILKRCDGRFNQEELIADLEAAFNQQGIGGEITNFLQEANRLGWLE
ncbi:MAG: pyrroloquinoline quinone biosynthesis peptide chaperone PqqD [Burkholderiales bacterium]|nr:pyrroloquinoline quinone biosynthesis peptide chaperone PqqD [Burkholderiales bacterium]